MRLVLLVVPLGLLAQRPVPVDNEWARVVVANSRPGPKGRPHQHSQNRVMIYLDKGAQRLDFQNGPSKDIVFDAGNVLWDPKGGIHTSENFGGTTFRVVEVELKKEGGSVRWPTLDPLKVAPNLYRLEFENDQVRVLRVKLGARQRIAEHDHALPHLVVPLSDAKIELTKPDGSKSISEGKTSDVLFSAPGRHQEMNVLDQPVELILVDLKF
jgi:quercetin dioxygenase-like cupin family protein